MYFLGFLQQQQRLNLKLSIHNCKREVACLVAAISAAFVFGFAAFL
jgi:hypothetical protein